jgi:hypothetical protein
VQAPTASRPSDEISIMLKSELVEQVGQAGQTTAN